MGVEYEHFVLPVRRDFRPSSETLARLVGELRRNHWVISDDHPHCASFTSGPMTTSGGKVTGYASPVGRNPKASLGRFGWPTVRNLPDPLDPAWLDTLTPADVPAPLSEELCLIFPVDVVGDEFSTFDEAELEYPFTFGADDLDANYHRIELHVSGDYVVDDCNNTFDGIDATCACGVELRYEVDRIEFIPAIFNPWRIKSTCPACTACFDPTTRSGAMRNGWTGAIDRLNGGLTYRFALRIDCGKGWPRKRGPLTLRPELRELVECVLGQPCEEMGGLY